VADARLRLCVVSEDLSMPLDEGLKKLVVSLLPPLTEGAEVYALSVRAKGAVPEPVRPMFVNRLFLSAKLWRAVRQFQPDVLLYVPEAAATRNSFLRLTALRCYAPRARSIMITLQPRSYSRLDRWLVRALRPSLILAQSRETRDTVAALGCPSALLPSGVDLSTFRPATRAEKLALREKHGVSPEAFVVVHVGHLEENRNVFLLNRLRSELDCETVLIASTWREHRRSVIDAFRAGLLQGGTHVIDHYLEHVAEAYQMADCYLFPTHTPGSAIAMPLSVLEALACGVPVVTTPFGQLPLWFHDGPGYTFGANDDELVAGVARLQQTEARPSSAQIRALAEPFTWNSIGRTVLELAGSLGRAEPWEFEPTWIEKDSNACVS